MGERRATDPEALLARVEALTDEEVERLLLAELTRGKAARGQALTPAQLAIYFAHQVAPEGTAYNCGCAGRIVGPLDVRRLSGAVDELVARHGQLRARFAWGEDQPVQWYEPPPTGVLQIRELAAGVDVRALLREEALRPYRIDSEPLVRFLLVRCGAEQHVLLLAIHHLIADQRSLAILWRDLDEAYRGRLGQQPPAPDYLQHCAAQASRRSEARPSLLGAWETRMADLPPPVPLPGRPEPEAMPPMRGGTVTRRVSKEISEGLFWLAVRCEAPPASCWLAAFAALIQQETGVTSLVCSTPFHGRSDPAAREIVGDFIEPVLLRVQPGPETPFEALVGHAGREMKEAFAAPGLQISDLVERMGPGARRSLTQICFSFQRVLWEDPALNAFCAEVGGTRIPFCGRVAEAIPLELQAGQFELELVVFPAADGTLIQLRYDLGAISEAIAERWMEHLWQLLEDAAQWPERPLRLLGNRAPGGEIHPPLLDPAKVR